MHDICRTIDRMGGLDAYLLGTPERKLDSDVGTQLRQHIEAALHMRAASQAAAQLPQAGDSTLSASRVRRMISTCLLCLLGVRLQIAVSTL